MGDKMELTKENEMTINKYFKRHCKLAKLFIDIYNFQNTRNPQLYFYYIDKADPIIGFRYTKEENCNAYVQKAPYSGYDIYIFGRNKNALYARFMFNLKYKNNIINSLQRCPIPQESDSKPDTAKIILSEKNIVVASKDGKNPKGFPTKQVETELWVEAGGVIIKKNQLMEYCEKNNIYYITHVEFMNLIRSGIVVCKLCPDEKYMKTSSSDTGDLSKESLLHECGYTVNTSDNLSAKRRQNILENVIRSDLYTIDKLIGFLGWQIHYNGQRKNMAEAVSKWRMDITFLESKRQVRNKI